MQSIKMVRRISWVALLAVALAASACSSSGTTPKTTTDVVAKTDTGPTPDVTSGDVAPDTLAGCGALPSCLNDKGQEDLGVCPKPASDYTCTAGCCVAIVKCKSNDDCAAQLGKAGGGCPDARFTCGCDLTDGSCVQTMCSTDADCGAGKICSQGGCIAPVSTKGLHARLLRPFWVGNETMLNTFDAAAALGAQAVDATGNVAPDAKFDWKLSTTDAFTLTAGTIAPTAKAGSATVTATVVGGDTTPSNQATLWNFGVGPAATDLRVTAVDDVSMAPLTGKAILIGLADDPTPPAAIVVDLVGGQATFTAVKYPCDIHIVPKDHAPVSVLRYTKGAGPADVVLPSPAVFFSDLEFDGLGVLSAASKLINGDILTGVVDYPGIGEAAIGLTSLAFGPSLLNFSLDSILGSNVKRPFDDAAPAIINPEKGKPQSIPGGVTFLLGKPVVTSYVVAGPPGKHILWDLGGRLALNDVLGQVGKVVDSVQGGLDVGRVVSVLLPYLAGFESQVNFDVPFAASLTKPIPKLDLKPTFPLGIKTDVTLPILPSAGLDAAGKAAFADLAFVIGGAMLPSGEFVPLGLTAGSDKVDSSDTADGLIDGDDQTPGMQPLALAVAPLHSGVRYGASNHTLITAAVILGGSGKKEGGSISITVPGTIAKTTNPETFLPFPMGSTYDKASATLTVKGIDGAQFYRSTLFGDEGNQWLIVLPKETAGKALKLPDLTQWGAPVNLAAAPKKAYVAGFELRSALSMEQLLTPAGLCDLVRQVKRTTFIDANP